MSDEPTIRKIKRGVGFAYVYDYPDRPKLSRRAAAAVIEQIETLGTLNRACEALGYDVEHFRNVRRFYPSFKESCRLARDRHLRWRAGQRKSPRPTALERQIGAV